MSLTFHPNLSDVSQRQHRQHSDESICLNKIIFLFKDLLPEVTLEISRTTLDYASDNNSQLQKNMTKFETALTS